MTCPPGFTEAEVLAAIEQAAKRWAASFVFGPHELEDVKQLARLECLAKMARFDPGLDESGQPTRSLLSFLSAVVHNHLSNVKRNELWRNECPCSLCPQGRHEEHEDGKPCKAFRTWRANNGRKASLTCPGALDSAPESKLASDGRVGEDAALREALAAIDERLDVSLRADYLRMRAGEKLPKDRREAVEQAVREIISWPA